jgi:hypothetical protein
MSVVREHDLGSWNKFWSLLPTLRSDRGEDGPQHPDLSPGLAIILVVGIYWFKVPFQGSFLLFALLSLLFIISGLSMGVLISTIAKTQKEASKSPASC